MSHFWITDLLQDDLKRELQSKSQRKIMIRFFLFRPTTMDSRSVPKAIYVNPVSPNVCLPNQKIKDFILSTKSFGDLTLNKKVRTLLQVVTPFFQRQPEAAPRRIDPFYDRLPMS
jgi:hypothetical protein